MIIDDIKHFLKAQIISCDETKKGQVIIMVAPDAIATAIPYLFKDKYLRFMTITGIDVRQYFELSYHFSDDGTGTIISIRTRLTDKSFPRIASITHIIIGANWIERELHEMLGIVFEGHPNLKHLLLSEDWPAGNFPLRQNGQSDAK
ncbi:MAG: NADH-quinone oxidoreductase subunit C [Elusimicrobia bacterium]|nr:NADH-quinone oxidoreductase subunit C [Elusimicrobiota bacterium]